MFKTRGELFILSAPSGAGKTTLGKMLRQRFDSISYSVSHTTRAPRAGEEDGVDYHFISKERFDEMIENNDFLEYAQVHGNMYGTSRTYIDERLREGRDILLDIDPQGAMQLKMLVSYGVFIFILPPSLEILRQRLTSRKDTYDSLELRLMNAEAEMAEMPKYDYVVVNDDLETAFSEVSSIYIAEKCRTKRIIDYSQFIAGV